MPFGPSSFSPLVVPAFLTGMLISGAALAWILAVRRRGRRCPECTGTTLPLVPGSLLRLLGKGVMLRWCPGCGWKGLATRPAHERQGLGGKIRLGGRFRWGVRPPPDPGFRFRDEEETDPALPREERDTRQADRDVSQPNRDASQPGQDTRQPGLP